MSDDSAADEADAETEHDAESNGLQEGDFVTVSYTARTVDGGDLVDTTSQEVADEEGVGEDQEFEPRTIVLGEEHIFPDVEDDIVGKEVGDEGSVVVPAPEAFGEYDDEEVRTISANKIDEDDRYPGAAVTVDGEQGYVETIIGGRARVDFNHPLAGEDVEYEYEVLDTVDDREEKAGSLLDTMLGMELDVWFETDVEEEEQIVEDADDLEAAAEEAEDDEDDGPVTETVEVEKETLYIEATPQLSMNQQWLIQKQQIAQQLIDLLGVDRVIVQETLGEGGGMMGGMGGMMGGMGGGGDVEDALEDADVDADELAEELDVEE